MYSTPLAGAVPLHRRDFKISWDGRVRERGSKRKSYLSSAFSIVQRILAYHSEF